MLTAFVFALAFQQSSVTIQIDDKKGASIQVRAREGRDSTRPNPRARTIVATPEQLANAFSDAAARSLLERARAARLSQDSSIRAYDATTVQRLTLGLAVTKLGRERIFFRHEGSARVRWARDVGAQINVIGKRSVVPMLGGKSDVDIESILSPVPYYPGRDALWIGLARANPNATEDDIIHPLANSAEAIYTYRTGDSISFRLPDGTTIQLRELEVRPRKADWHAVVGSLWFDARTGQLVRAGYRLSQPNDFLKDDKDDDGLVVKALFRPANASITGVAVEYGLYQGRFWLPRSQVGEGLAQMGFVRVPMRIEEHFTYATVNALDSLPVVPPPRDFRRAADSAAARRNIDSVITAERAVECATTGSHSMRATRHGGALPVVVHIPCDSLALANSPTLPKSIFDKGDEIFGDAERDALLAKAKAMIPNMPLGPRRPEMAWGVGMLRYNRVEGLSSAVEITQDLGSAYTIRLRPRIGLADLVPNAELSLRRTTGEGTIALTGYGRLNAANDWGQPLDFGSGVSALLFGRDEGFYYRTLGAELGGDHLLGTSSVWRVFHERQTDASPHTNVSLAKAWRSAGFDPGWNIEAARIVQSGASIRHLSSFGLDPNATRLLADARLEGAFGGRDYGRGALDLTISQPIAFAFNRMFAAALTIGAGSSLGAMPVQRLWYLGGTSTVRGQPAGAMFGNSYWLTRTEVGYGSAGFRRIAFFDLGWAGDRNAWREVGRPASGAGIGWSFLDGLIRADIARGFYPNRDWRGALYLEGRF
jgi:hypothetical protein